MRYLVFCALVAIFIACPGGAAPVLVGGVVTLPDGRPLPGAEVEIAGLPRNLEVVTSLLEKGYLPSEAVARTATDAEGRFLLEAPQGGVWKVTVRAAGFVAMEYAPLPLVLDADLPPVVLFQAEEVQVVLLNPEARPAVEIPVQVASPRRDFWQERARHGWRPGPRFSRSDGDGRLVVLRAPGEELKLYAMSPDRLPAERRVSTETAVTMRLPPAPPWRRVLQVHNPDGGPAAGVVVIGGEQGWPLGRTDARGRLEIPLEGGAGVPLQLLTEHRIHGVTVSPPATPPPSSSTDAIQRITLPPLRRVHGRVVDARGGKAIAGALVWSGREAAAFVRTDGEGAFAVNTSAEGRFWVQVEAPGFLPRLHRVPETPTTHGAGTSALRIALERAVRVEGKVVDGKGRPVAGVQVSANAGFREKSPTFRLDGAEERTRSDEEGRFALSSLVARGAYEVTADKVGYQRSRFPLTVGAARETPWTLVLEAARSAAGKVVDGEERPLAGVRVTVVASPEKEGRGTREPVIAISDPEGLFLLPELPAAAPGQARRVDLEARKEGFIPLKVRRLALPEGSPEDGGPMPLGTLILTPGTALRGRVIDSAGEPLAEASVWLVADTGQSLTAVEALRRADPTTLTDSQGRFRIEDLPFKERVHLLCNREGYLSATRLGVRLPHEGDLRIRLDRGVVVRGRVLDEAGEGLAEARVRLHSGGSPEGVVAVQRQAVEGSHVVYTDPDGAFQIVGAAPGAVTLDALAEGYQPSTPVDLDLPSEGEVDDVTLVLTPGATLEGRVTNARGEPVEAARLSMGRRAAASDETGFYRLPGLPPGVGSITVRHRAYRREAREVEIELGVLHNADFVLEGGWSIEGRVVDVDEEPIAGAQVELRHRDPLDRRRYRALTDSEGLFAVEGVTAGSYDLEAGRQGYATVRQEAAVEVAEAPVTDLEIRLEPGATLSGRILGLDFEDLAVVQVEAQRGEETRVGTVDYSGAYTLQDLGPGGWLVLARLRGGSREARARVLIAAGERRRERDLEFDQGLTLTGEVLYGGAGLVGARVTLTGGELTVERSVLTDHGGGFRLEDLSAGSYRVTVNHSRELINHTEDVSFTGDHDLQIVIATASVRGRVVSAAAGEPLEDAQIRLQRMLGPGGTQPGPVVQVGTGPEGTFLLARVATGRHRLFVQKAGYGPVEQALEVQDGAEQALEIPLTSTEGLELVVTLGSGERPPYAAVVVYDTAGRSLTMESAAVDGEGVARFRTVPGGTWDVLVGAPGGALTRLIAAVPSRQEVTLPRAARLRVRVPLLEESDQRATLTLFDPQARPVEAVDGDGALRRRFTVVGGQARVDSLPPGVWSLRVVGADGQIWQGTAATTEGGEAAVILE